MKQITEHIESIIQQAESFGANIQASIWLTTPQVQWFPAEKTNQAQEERQTLLAFLKEKLDKKPIIINNLQPNIGLKGTLIAAPVFMRNQTTFIGMIILRGTTPFQTLHSLALESLTRELGLALEARATQSNLDRAERILNTQHNITRLIVARDEWQSNLPAIAAELAKLTASDAAAIVLWDASQQKMTHLAPFGLPPDALAGETETAYLEETIQNATPIHLNTADALQKQLPKLDTFQALVGLPLSARNRTIGFIFLMRGSIAYSEQDLLPVRTSLDQIALSIDNHSLLKDTQKRLQETNALLEMAALTATTNELDAVLQQALELTQKMLDVEAGAIMLYDEQQQALKYHTSQSSFGIATQYKDLIIPITDTPGIVAKVYQSGEPKFINNIHLADFANPEIVKQTKTHNMLIAPLRTHEIVLGVFIISNKTSDFTHKDTSLVMALGTHIAAALRNVQLLEDTRLRLQETEILQRIAAVTSATLDQDAMLTIGLSEIVRLLGCEGGQFLLLNQDYLIPHVASRYGSVKKWDEEPLALNSNDTQVKVFNAEIPTYLNNIQHPHYNSILTVPLNTRQGVIGAMTLINRKDGKFTGSHGDLAWAVASQIAIGIKNVELFDRERQRADRMLLINRIGQELSATLDLRSLMHKVVTNIHDALGYDTVYIFLLEDEQKTLICQAAATTNPDHNLPAGFLIPIEKGIAGQAVRERQTILDHGMEDNSHRLVLESHEDLKSTLAVPLKHGDNIYGVIELLGIGMHAFNETDKITLESLATQVSVAVDNARLYNQAQRRLMEQGIVYQIGQDIIAILDYEGLVQAVARHMTRALDTSTCHVAIYDPRRERIRVEAIYQLPGTEEKATQLEIGASYPLSRLHAIRQAIMTRRPIITYMDDEDTPTTQVNQMLQSNDMSEMIVPMMVSTNVIGVVRWSENRRMRRFTREDERLAQTLISQASIAIENARLFQEAEQRAYEQSLLNQIALSAATANSVDVLITQLTQQIHDALSAHNTLISLSDQSGQFMIRGQVLSSRSVEKMMTSYLLNNPNKGKLIWKALKNGEGIYTGTDSVTQTSAQMEMLMLLKDTRALALVPITYRQKLIGILEVSNDNIHTFDKTTAELLGRMANQTAIVIDNVYLSEREQHRLSQLERLQISGSLITSELNLDNLPSLIAQEVVSLFDIPAFAFTLADELGVGMVIKASHGLSETYVNERRMPMPNQIEFAKLNDEERRRPHYYADLSMLQIPAAQKDLIEAEGLKSALQIPIVKGLHKFGDLILYSYQVNHIFSDEDIEIARLLSSQIAVALDNADLFQALEDRAQELAQANRLKSQFLANISHELRTPMNSILGFSETILSGIYGNINETVISRIERINRNGKNLLALIDDLLDLSKIDAGRMVINIEPVDLGREIREVISAIESQAQKKSITITLDAPPELPLVMADSLRLHQVINNLVSNALKFTEEGGITIKVSQKNEVKLTPAPNESRTQDVIWVSVTDTGIGISLEDQLIIFDEFRQVDGGTTRQYGGTGLGLAICKRLIEIMGGRIWVDSEVGKGSTFTFVIPVAIQKTSEGN